MKQVVSAVAGNLPRQLKNFHLIKRQDIYIPFCEIGITCLTKEVTEINLFFETSCPEVLLCNREFQQIFQLHNKKRRFIHEPPLLLLPVYSKDNLTDHPASGNY